MSYNIDLNQLYEFYRSFRYLFLKLKQGSKLNYYDKELLCIFNEYSYILEYSEEWRKRDD